MKLVIETIKGCEGNSLSVGNIDDKGYGSGTRIAGAKPWGGGNVIDSFEIDVYDLESVLKEFAYVYPKETLEVCKKLVKDGEL